MKRFLVTLEPPPGSTQSAPILGIYVEADSKHEAIEQAKAYVATCDWAAWAR